MGSFLRENTRITVTSSYLPHISVGPALLLILSADWETVTTLKVRLARLARIQEFLRRTRLLI